MYSNNIQLQNIIPHIQRNTINDVHKKRVYIQIELKIVKIFIKKRENLGRKKNIQSYKELIIYGKLTFQKQKSISLFFYFLNKNFYIK